MPAGNLPRVPPIVLYHAATITIRRIERRLDRSGIAFEGSSIGCANVNDVHVEKCRAWISLARFTDHDLRVTDLDYRRRRRLELTGCAEHVRNEFDEPACISSHDPRRDGMPTGRGRVRVRLGHRRAAERSLTLIAPIFFGVTYASIRHGTQWLRAPPEQRP